MMKWFSACLMMVLMTGTVRADLFGLEVGDTKLQSAGPMTFGPDGILFLGDTKAAQIVAIQTGDQEGDPSAVSYPATDLMKALKSLPNGNSPKVIDLAVNPLSGNVYLSVSFGDRPAIVKITESSIEELPLNEIAFSKSTLKNVPEDKVVGEGRRKRNRRGDAITDLAWVDGEIIISGLSNSTSAASTVRSLVFPFSKADVGAPLEIYHAAHGRSEDSSAPRTFVPFIINGEPNLLAGFVCTPLVKFPVKAISGKEQITGTTVAELGNRNRPLDMIVYKQGSSNWLLMANSARGVMKISTANIEKEEGLTTPVRGGGKAGLDYTTIDSLNGTIQLDKLNDTHAVVIMSEDGTTTLKSVELP